MNGSGLKLRAWWSGKARGCCRDVICIVLLAMGVLCAADKGWAADMQAPSPEKRLQSVITCMTLGRSLFRDADYRGAAIEFEKALALDPANDAARQLLARCEEKSERGIE